jgi:iron(III) transport system ATP-binding protein
VAELSLDRVTKRFGGHAAVDSVTLELASGGFLALLGPSGCGKTTLLRLIAGFEAPDEGSVAIAGRTVAAPGRAVPPERRGIAMVFQSYALWPHMSVSENVGYALRVRRVPAAERRRKVAACLDQVGLGHLAGRRPAELSGGQRQRVALARCLAMDPAVVLLDEPLANLDAHLRESLQEEFRRFHRETGATMVYVTHDQGEAMAMADRVAVMDRGVLHQVAAPQTLYHRPATAMVARFVGRGTLVPARVAAPLGEGRARVEALGATAEVRHDGAPGAHAALLVRADTTALAGPGEPGIPGRVRRVVYRGDHYAVDVAPDALPEAILALRLRADPPGEGEAVSLALRDGWLVPDGDAGRAGRGAADPPGEVAA